MHYTVHRGRKYKASIVLQGFESFASNQDVKAKLREAGFVDVIVTGSGGVRYATGKWGQDDATAPMPSQIHQVIELEEDIDDIVD